MTSIARELTAEGAARGARELIEYCYERGWTDGLPVVPPTQEFVDEFLAQTLRSPDEVLMLQEHLDRTCTVRHAAINAVMAGCKPDYFPILLALLDAFEASAGARSGLLQSTTGQAEIAIVNGPVRNQLGFNSKENIFGSGDRPNATIGRALRLVIMNALGIRPHEFDQSTQGTSAKYSCVIAENEEDSPWEPLHVERGFAPEASTVTVQMVRGDLYVEHRGTQVPEEILLTIADTMSHAGMITQVTDSRSLHSAVVVMGPEHANCIAARGWSKQDVKQFLWEHFGKTKRQLLSYGKLHRDQANEPEDAFIHSSRSPDSILLVVSGANNAGVSTVCPSIVSTQAGATVGHNMTRAIDFKG
ncbi:MAG TPA: hypothetical protein VJB57_14990 [Dehalococcoidia bacterium]|nr:hypothetical protein [Dehalococcoidia bacterium]